MEIPRGIIFDLCIIYEWVFGPGILEAKIEPLRGKHTNVLMQMVHVGVLCQKPDRSGYFTDVVTSKGQDRATARETYRCVHANGACWSCLSKA